MKLQRPLRQGSRNAFTLAEVAVTIALVGLALAWMLQTLNTAKVTAAYTRNIKLARELALLTLGQIESGLYAEDVDDERIEGTYAEEGYPDFAFEAVIGDESFRPDENDSQAFDSWRHDQDLKRRAKAKEGDTEDAEQPYEKIQIKVTFRKIQDLDNEYVIERWLPWEQIHPEEAAEPDAGESGATGAAGGSSKSSPNKGGGAK